MVEIRYPEGSIEIYPAEFFKTGGIRAFRKLVKMSAKSDAIYGTNAIKEWKKAVSAELFILEHSAAGDKAQERIKNKLEKFKNILEEYEAHKN